MSKNTWEMWNLFLDDGSQIFEDEEILDAEMVQGKLLTIARTFKDFKEPALTINEACIKQDTSRSESQKEASTSKLGESTPSYTSSEDETNDAKIADSDECKLFGEDKKDWLSSLKGILSSALFQKCFEGLLVRKSTETCEISTRKM